MQKSSSNLPVGVGTASSLTAKPLPQPPMSGGGCSAGSSSEFAGIEYTVDAANCAGSPLLPAQGLGNSISTRRDCRRIERSFSTLSPYASSAPLTVHRAVFVKYIAAGAQGSVAIVRFPPCADLYAVKVSEYLPHERAAAENAFLRAKVMSRFSNFSSLLQIKACELGRIVASEDHAIDASKPFYVCILRPFFPGGDGESLWARVASRGTEGLRQQPLLRGPPALRPRRAATFALQIAGALRKLHEEDIVHGDIKAANIVFSSSNFFEDNSDGGNVICALADFDSVRFLPPSRPRVRIGRGGVEMPAASDAFTLDWSAPEVVASEGKERTMASDIWSFGVLFLSLLTCRNSTALRHVSPLSSSSPSAASSLDHIVSLPLEWDNGNQRLLTASVEAAAKDAIRRATTYKAPSLGAPSPAEQWRLAEMLRHAEQQLNRLVPLIVSCLQFNPSDRIAVFDLVPQLANILGDFLIGETSIPDDCPC